MGNHSKMEPHNIYSHKMAINTHYIQERTIVLYSQSKEKIKKKIEKTNFEKKSKCHISNFFEVPLSKFSISLGRVCLAPRPQVDTPINLHLTIKKKRRRKIKKKKIQKNNFEKKIQKNLSRTPKKKKSKKILSATF